MLALAGLALRTVEERRPTLGFFMDLDSNGAIIVRAVDSGSSAAQAGIRVGDRIINLNGGEVPRRVGRWLQEQEGGAALELRGRRADQELSLEVRPGGLQKIRYPAAEDAHAGVTARHLR